MADGGASQDQNEIPVQVKADGAPGDQPENPVQPKEQAWVTPAPIQTEAQDAGEATQEDPANVNGGSTGTGDSKLSAAKGRCSCCSLKRTVLMGDSMSDEDMKFGKPITDSYGTIVRTQVCHQSVQIIQQVLLASPFVLILTVFAANPTNGNAGATGLTVVIQGTLAMFMNMTAAVSPVMFTDPSRMYQYLGWSWLSMMPLTVGNVVVKWKYFADGVKDASQTQLWTFPAAAVMAISMGKMHTIPGWVPSWKSCWCVCGGLSRAVGTCCLYYLAGLFAVLTTTNWIYYDNNVFSLNESLTMLIARPIAFTMIKKLVWAIFAIQSWLRHPFLVKSVTMAGSAILGFTTAVAFTKTRNWTGLVLFILTNVVSHSSRLWVFTGARFSTSCFLLEWFKRFMIAGKPIASSSRMKLRDLRGFENMCQSWGTTFGMAMIVVFYPIVKLGFGDDSMAARFFFPTDLSFVFLIIAYITEIAMDLHTQITTIYGTKCDYAGYFDLNVPWRSPMVISVHFLCAFVGALMNAAWDRDRVWQVEQGTETPYR